MTTPLPTICDCSGSAATAYWNSNPDCTAPPVFTELLDVKGDMNFGNTPDATENTPRGKNQCFKTYVKGKSDLEISFDIGCSLDYEGNDVFVQMNQCANPAPKDLLFLTRCILDTNAFGYRGCFMLSNFTNNNPASGNATTSITVKPAAACSGCACPVRLVQVDTAGEIVDVAAMVAQTSSKAMQLMASGVRMAAMRDNLVSVQGALALTGAKTVNVEIDDIMRACQAIGKHSSNIVEDFKFLGGDDEDDSPLLIGAMRQSVRGKKVTRAYAEFDRLRLSDYLDEVLTGLSSLVASL